MKKINFRGAFGYDVEEASNASAIDFKGVESLTFQSMAEDADINVLMERFGITGQMPQDPEPPVYGDFSEVFDYQTALNAVADANYRFGQLPAKVRARFSNDPQVLLEFIADDANIDEARKLGFLKEKVDGQSGAGSAVGPGSEGSPRSSAKDPGVDGVVSRGRSAPPGGGKEAAGASGEGEGVA